MFKKQLGTRESSGEVDKDLGKRNIDIETRGFRAYADQMLTLFLQVFSYRSTTVNEEVEIVNKKWYF